MRARPRGLSPGTGIAARPGEGCSRHFHYLEEHGSLGDRVAGADPQAGHPPGVRARSGFSIFIASTTARTWPAATFSPSATAIRTTVPCIGALIMSPAACPACCRRSRTYRPARASGPSAA